LVAVATGICLAAAGCAGKAPKQTQFMKSIGTIGITAESLRLQVRDGASPYAGIIEDAADRILLESDDPEIRRKALMWKARAIPIAMIAIFREDPLMALVDIWAYTYQLKQFFEEGAGRDGFGEYQSIAIEACDRLEAAIHALALEASNEKANLPRARQQLAEFAREYPIESWNFNRETVPAHLDAFEEARQVAGLAVAGKLATDMSDISSRFGILAAQLPAQVAWEAEILAETYVTGDDVDRALADLTDIPMAVDRLRLFAEESADLVLKEKDALLAELEAEDGPLGNVLGETEAFITRERMAIIAELKSERAVVMDAIQADLDELVETLQAERAVVLGEVRAISDDTVGSLSTQIEGAIDHFFLRLVQLLAVLVVLGFVGGYVLVRTARKQAA
jgi:hypothetical protein